MHVDSFLNIETLARNNRDDAPPPMRLDKAAGSDADLGR